jgi:hypothetical protein
MQPFVGSVPAIDPRRKTVTFWGQANQTVVMGWDELKVD